MKLHAEPNRRLLHPFRQSLSQKWCSILNCMAINNFHLSGAQHLIYGEVNPVAFRMEFLIFFQEKETKTILIPASVINLLKATESQMSSIEGQWHSAKVFAVTASETSSSLDRILFTSWPELWACSQHWALSGEFLHTWEDSILLILFNDLSCFVITYLKDCKIYFLEIWYCVIHTM